MELVQISKFVNRKIREDVALVCLHMETVATHSYHFRCNPYLVMKQSVEISKST
jgi:hypothetical protein